MKTQFPRSFPFALGLASLAMVPLFDAGAQTTVATDPVGYLQTSCLSNSDTLVAPSFLRPAAFVGAAASTSTNVTAGTGTITLSNASLTADAYDVPATTPYTKDSYFLLVGPATATLTGTVTVTQNSTAVTGSSTTFGTDIKAGDRLAISDGINRLTYTVAVVNSTTSLTLDRPFVDSAATNLSSLSATYDHSPYEGRFYQVVSNDASTITVNLNGDTLSSVAAGTQVSVIPYWTLNSIYPASDASATYIPTTSTRQTNNTQILVPNYAGSGINLATGAIYIYYSNGSNVGWRNTNNLNADRGYDPLQPDGYFTVRNPSTTNLPLTFAGGVPVNRLATSLATMTAGLQDNAVALNRPAAVTVGSLGLNPTDGSFVATTSTRSTGDQLFVYNNAVASFNKSSSAIYVYYNAAGNVGWRNTNSLTTDASTDVIPAGSALTIRKAATTTAQTVFWNNSPNY